ncbi:MAG: T9SS type A sorting domain-containing protein [Paludibacteraceae bacterium]|nr:T9SS type A sorting domain-containing protein [Paludibacteraceae bacterium]
MDTICYDSIPSQLYITVPSIAGLDDTVRYQWQDSVSGGIWTDIQNATGLSYQPSALQSTHYYRVIATSDKGCGSFVSNVTEIAVFGDLQVSINGSKAPFCYMTQADVTISAIGAGEIYSYQWQDSVDGTWHDIGTDDSIYSFIAETVGLRYLRCIVSSVNGCSSKISPVVAVQTYQELNAGTILPVDTVCYGFRPDTIHSGIEASGCDGIFIYSWEKSTDGEVWSNIPNSNSTVYQPTSLTQNTFFRRKARNAYCNVEAYSNYIKVEVRRDITLPVIGQYLDTICFNTMPNQLTIIIPSLHEVDDTVRYQWQDSTNGGCWNNISGATELEYQPEVLTASRYYRVVGSSDKGCGFYYSNVVKINVFHDLVIVNNPVDTICYMTSTQLTFTATGEGGRYSYQWQESSDSINFTDIRNEKRSDYWTDDKPDGKYYYRCIVTPKNGCSVDTSDVFVVNVYKELKPGKIGSDQVVCKNEDASELTFITLPDGGDTNRYTYQWEYSLDMTDWYNVTNETSTSYTPRNMQQTTYYRVKVRNSCGLDYTDTVEILVNPLPDTVIISGNQYVCYNKYEYYEIPEMITGFDYQWSLDNPNAGEIITDPSNETQIRVLWIAANSGANIVLTVTNTETGCLSRNYYPVAIANEMAPDTTIIIRKPNSNIFVCQDSITDHYQWGSIEKSSGNETMFENSDRRYCQVEGGIDTTKYIYWLDLWNGDSARCVSRSIYTPSDDEEYIHQPKQNIRIVSSTRGYIMFEIDNPSGKDVNVALYSITGTKLKREYFGNNIAIKAHVPIDVPAGVYLLRVEIGTDCETFKLIAE